MKIQLVINRAEVLAEVDEATDYTATKQGGEADDRDRVATVDGDTDILGRFWDEAVSAAMQALMRHHPRQSQAGDLWTLTLEVSNNFATNLKASMTASLRRYFVQAMAGSWYAVTRKEAAPDAIAAAAALLTDVQKKAYYKKPKCVPGYFTGIVSEIAEGLREEDASEDAGGAL